MLFILCISYTREEKYTQKKMIEKEVELILRVNDYTGVGEFCTCFFIDFFTLSCMRSCALYDVKNRTNFRLNSSSFSFCFKRSLLFFLFERISERYIGNNMMICCEFVGLSFWWLVSAITATIDFLIFFYKYIFQLPIERIFFEIWYQIQVGNRYEVLRKYLMNF